MTGLRDAIAINLKTQKVRILDSGKTIQDAQAIVNMAVLRRGVQNEFFAVVATGSYVEGEDWQGGANDPDGELPW
jgi:hypothetical protein